MTGVYNSHKLLLYNAAIWCAEQDDLSWMLINQKTGRVEEVGRGDIPSSDRWTNCQKKDGKGLRVFPGLIDSHIHVSQAGRLARVVDLTGVPSVKQLQQKLAESTHQYPERVWVMGMGWNDHLMERMPTRDDLDEACPDKPCIAWRVCTHVVVANTRALQLGGFTADSVVHGGKVGIFPEGHPKAAELDGSLYEMQTFRTLTERALAENKMDDRSDVMHGIDLCLRYGLTSVHALEGSTWPIYCDLADQGMLPIRVFYSAYYSHRQRKCFPMAGETHGDMLSCDRMKIFQDGGLCICTAALSEPYTGQHQCGIHIQPQDELNHQIQEATAAGYRLEVHVIGDAAADAVLTALETVQVAPEKRPILTHCQILRPDLIKRMKSRGVIANIQPQFVPTDSEVAEKLIPAHLLQCSYPWKTLMDQGIICAGGSDAPVETPNPLRGMYDAIFRPRIKTSAHEPEKSFRPEECLSVSQAVDLYTRCGAYTARREQDLGQLLPGFMADFVLIEAPRDVIRYPEDLLQAKVQEVWVAGQQKFKIDE